MGDYLSHFTFYDVVGYLLPGSLAVVALALVVSMIDPAWAIPSPTGLGMWGTLIVGAYFVGHALQGVSSKLLRRSTARAKIATGASDRIITAAKRVLALHEVAAVSNAAVVDAVDLLRLPSADQEIYVARQGFYRGGAAAFILFMLVLLISGSFNLPATAFGVAIPRAASVVGGISAIPLAWIFEMRYVDFVRYEIEFGIAAAIRDEANRSD